MSNIRTARQFRVQSPGLAEIVQVDLPPGQAGEVLVRARYSGISRGTEALVFQGRSAAVAVPGHARAVPAGRIIRDP